MTSNAVIEMPADSRYKYEIKNGILVLDRVLSIPTPANYGYIDNTLAEDGDPIDVFVVSKEPIYPGARVQVELIGMFYCIDGAVTDNKLVGRLQGTSDGVSIESIRDYLEKYKVGFEVQDYTKDEFAIKQEINLGRIK